MVSAQKREGHESVFASLAKSQVVTFISMGHPMTGNVVLPTTQHVEIDCREVWKELVNYMEGDLMPEMRARLDRHLQGCKHCTAIYEGTQNVVRLVGDRKMLELPQGFSQRLYQRLVTSA